MAQLELQGLHKRFGDVIALKSLDLTINSGEFVTFLGPSGCGKTTALRIVAGFERPDSGRVTVGEKDITNIPANRRDMGMVFQAYSLFPNLTALDNVAFGLRVRRVARPERTKRAAELLELIGLSSAANRYPHQLSGGQQQRVALARALAIRPSVLLLDEPLSALDAKVRVQLRDEIRRIQTQLGITALFVTHDQEEALSISDRVVVLSQGHIEQVGTPAEIYGDPKTVFVAQFVGTMNRIAGVISAVSAGTVECPGGSLRADAAREQPASSRVMLLIRPEAIDLTVLDEGRPPPDGGLSGRLTTRTFLGAVTRLNVTSPVGDLKVDIGSSRALSLAEGATVGLSWNPATPKLIPLADDSSQQSPALSLPDQSGNPPELKLTARA
ncbi:MAG: spermidine/putrescine transporter ATP-binding protein [Chloroflexi bacterium]|nr:spermidine/putrescine transporter ATP-binding protein [Chloroflexota bacterium]